VGTQGDIVGLEWLLTPCSVGTFFEEYHGVKFLRILGQAARFSSLLPWAVLNDILEHHQLTAPRLRLVKDGRIIPLGSFTRPGENPEAFLRLLSPAVTAHLRRGATLIIDAIDELYQPITRLARFLERDLRAPVRINMYAGFGMPRFEHHWDLDHVFKLQIVGKTKWQLNGHISGFPPSERTRRSISRPLSGPVWEGVLDAGDLLYIPRGWWYAGAPCGEATIHFSVAFSTLTGVGILQWLTELLEAKEYMRRDIPRYANDATRTEYLKVFREVIIQELDNPDLLSRFFARIDDQAQARPSFALPSTAMARISPESDAHIELLAPRGLNARLVAGEDAIEISAEGAAVLRFHSDVGPLLNYLNQNSEVSVSAFVSTFSDFFESDQLMEVLTALAENGLISVKGVSMGTETSST
jgi:hypothetical protein